MLPERHFVGSGSSSGLALISTPGVRARAKQHRFSADDRVYPGIKGKKIREKGEKKRRRKKKRKGIKRWSEWEDESPLTERYIRKANKNTDTILQRRERGRRRRGSSALKARGREPWKPLEISFPQTQGEGWERCFEGREHCEGRGCIALRGGEEGKEWL